MAEGKSGEQEADKKKTGNGGTATYTLVTAALSIVTGGTVTWMEAIIVLLPEILAGLKYLFGESNHSKLMRLYEETVIPQVTNSLFVLGNIAPQHLQLDLLIFIVLEDLSVISFMFTTGSLPKYVLLISVK